MKKATISGILLLLLALSIGACSNLSYYGQSINGHFDIMNRREPIPELLRNPKLKPELRAKLELVLQVRDFASDKLSLPDNGSYRSYVDLKRNHVVWNVFAAPEFSVEAKSWCFLFTGCVSYKGYYAEDDAKSLARELEEQGLDVYVAGIDAYSTLGWFDDPVLNTFIRRNEAGLAGLIFHELTHQLLYVKNDSTFNESFATTVELEGVSLWLKKQKKQHKFKTYLKRKHRHDEFINLILDYRERLKKIYGQNQVDEEKRVLKKQAFASMQRDYKKLKKKWLGYKAFDDWMKHDLNNAHLVSVGTYHEYVPAFQLLLKKQDHDMEKFFLEAERLADLDKKERDKAMQTLLKSAAS